MSEWKKLTDESKNRWDQNAEFWDDYMGVESNQFHRELIRPYTEELLQVQEGQTILDIACGNGNFSRRLAELGANVVAFDYSSKMVERAKKRSQEYADKINYYDRDATNYESLISFGENRFDSAIANMALMDIADITPLVRAVYELLMINGSFVFSITHPCFQTPGMRKIQETEEKNGEIITRYSIQTFGYLASESYEAIGIKGQPVSHLMFHRPMSYYLKLLFDHGFILDGIEEPSFQKEKDIKNFDWYEIPPVVIMRFRKLK